MLVRTLLEPSSDEVAAVRPRLDGDLVHPQHVGDREVEQEVPTKRAVANRGDQACLAVLAGLAGRVMADTELGRCLLGG